MGYLLLYRIISNQLVVLGTKSIWIPMVNCPLLAWWFSSFINTLKLSVTDRRNAGDVTKLAKFMFIPTSWGALFFGQSIAATFLLLIYFID